MSLCLLGSGSVYLGLILLGNLGGHLSVLLFKRLFLGNQLGVGFVPLLQLLLKLSDLLGKLGLAGSVLLEVFLEGSLLLTLLLEQLLSLVLLFLDGVVETLDLRLGLLLLAEVLLDFLVGFALRRELLLRLVVGFLELVDLSVSFCLDLGGNFSLGFLNRFLLFFLLLLNQLLLPLLLLCLGLLLRLLFSLFLLLGFLALLGFLLGLHLFL